MVELLRYWASWINIKQGHDEVTCSFRPGLEARRNRLPTVLHIQGVVQGTQDGCFSLLLVIPTF